MSSSTPRSTQASTPARNAASDLPPDPPTRRKRTKVPVRADDSVLLPGPAVPVPLASQESLPIPAAPAMSQNPSVASETRVADVNVVARLPAPGAKAAGQLGRFRHVRRALGCSAGLVGIAGCLCLSSPTRTNFRPTLSTTAVPITTTVTQRPALIQMPAVSTGGAVPSQSFEPSVPIQPRTESSLPENSLTAPGEDDATFLRRSDDAATADAGPPGPLPDLTPPLPSDPSAESSSPPLTPPATEPPAESSAPPVELKIEQVGTASVNGIARFQVTLRNRSSAPVEQVIVYCEFDQALQFADSPEREVMQRLGTMAPGELKELTLSLNCLQTGKQSCLFSVRSLDAEQFSAELTRQRVELDVRERQIELRMIAPPRRTVGSKAELTLQLINRTSEPMTRPRLKIQYDAALIAREATEGAHPVKGGLDWTLETLAPREELQLQVEFECLTTAHRAQISCDFEVDGQPSEQRECSLEITPVVGHLDLRIQDRDDPLTVGKETTVEISLQNVGLLPCHQIRLELAAPEQVSLGTVKLRRGDSEQAITVKHEERRLVFDPIPVLAPDETVTLLVTVHAEASGVVELIATVQHAAENSTSTMIEPLLIIASDPVRP